VEQTREKTILEMLWKYEPIQMSFLLRSVYNVLPFPTNLTKWKLSEDLTFLLYTHYVIYCHPKNLPKRVDIGTHIPFP